MNGHVSAHSVEKLDVSIGLFTAVTELLRISTGILTSFIGSSQPSRCYAETNRRLLLPVRATSPFFASLARLQPLGIRHLRR